MTSIPIAIFRLFAFLLESLFLSTEPRFETKSNKKKNSSSSSGSSSSSRGSSNDASNDNDNKDSRHQSSLQAAFQYFEIENPEKATWEAIKRKYRRLGKIHHPDRNNQSEESKNEMQKINNYYELLEKEFDRREGKNSNKNDIHVEEPMTPTAPTDVNTEPDDPDDPHEPGISRDEYKRRRKLKKQQRQKAQKREKEEAKRREEALRKEREEQARRIREAEEKRRREREQEMRREWKEARQKMKEFQKQEQQTRQFNEHMIREAMLDEEFGREKAYYEWMLKVVTIQKEEHENDIGSNPHRPSFFSRKPRNPIMEYSNDDVGVALKLGATDIAMELVHESIEFCLAESMKEIMWEKAMNGMPPNLTQEDLSKIYKDTYTTVLASPLDEDDNHVLFYVIYHEDNDMLSYLTTQARRLNRFSQYITSTNGRGSTILDFCVGSSNTAFKNRVKALYEEGQKEDEAKARASSVIQQSRYYFQQIRQHWNLEPALFSAYSMLLGQYIFHTSWYGSLLVVVVTRLLLVYSSKHQLYNSLVVSHCAWLLFRSVGVLAWRNFPLWLFLCAFGGAKCSLSFREVIILVPSIIFFGCEFLLSFVLTAVDFIVFGCEFLLSFVLTAVDFIVPYQLRLALDVVAMCSAILLLRRYVWLLLVPTGWNMEEYSWWNQDQDISIKPLLQMTPRELMMAWFNQSA